MVLKSEYYLEAKGIVKSFSGVEVLHGVDFFLKKGEIHGLAGANGAGKSTLMKILNGVYSLDEGQIFMEGNAVYIKTPIDAAEAGIAMVFQEFSLIPSMTVSQNVFLGREPCGKVPFINHKEAKEKTLQALKQLKVNIDPDDFVENLSVGNQQIVEIAKALSKNCQVLILDEPTASLCQSEIQILFKILKTLKDQGISIIMITHHLQEIIDICDEVTVLRDGNVVLQEKTRLLKVEDIIKALVGREIEYGDFASIDEEKKVDHGSSICLEIKKLCYNSVLSDVSFKLMKGEALGLAGLLGSGRTEVLKSIYGLLRPSSGEIYVNNKKINFNHPADAQNAGIYFVPENRHKDGIIKGQTLLNNIMLSVWKKYTRSGFLNFRKAAEKTQALIKRLKIKTMDENQLIEKLSGGNQQKAVIAKAIAGDAEILLLDEPTVGVDVASKQEILGAVRKYAEEGKAVLIVSSEMEELAQVCDRVLVIKEGKIIIEFDRKGTTEITEDLLLAASQGQV